MPNRWLGSGQVHGVGGFCAIGAHSSGRGLDDSDYGYGPLSFSVACPNYAEPDKKQDIVNSSQGPAVSGYNAKTNTNMFRNSATKKTALQEKKTAVQFFVLIGKY